MGGSSVIMSSGCESGVHMCSKGNLNGDDIVQQLGGVQQQKRSCRRENPRMSFVFFVLF